MLLPAAVLLIQAQVAPDLDLVIQRDRAELVLFLQSRASASLRYLLTRSPGPVDCTWQVERVAPSDAILTCVPEKGVRQLTRKFVYDVRAKALVKQIDFEPYAMDRVWVSQGRGYVLGKRALEYIPGADPPLQLAEGFSLSRPRQPHSPCQPPISTYDQFARARPERVKDGYTRESTHLEEGLGAIREVNGQIWFAKSFYDGEGTSGIGGFGYCDRNTGQMHLFSSEAIADWSASALFVEADAVWLGLVQNGEYGSSPGGIARYDRETKRTVRIELPEIVHDMARIGSAIVMATDLGTAVWEAGRIRRFLISLDTDGRLVLSEAATKPANPQSE